jgi:predicted nucleic acid-binding protein
LIVIDASVAIRALLSKGEARQKVRTEDLHAPGHIDVEITSALRRLERVGTLSGRHALEALDRWRLIGLRRYFTEPVIGRVWQLRQNLTPYDAAYVALAESLDCSLLTADRGHVGAAGVRCPIIFVST